MVETHHYEYEIRSNRFKNKTVNMSLHFTHTARQASQKLVF
jgi:hypothetical protein